MEFGEATPSRYVVGIDLGTTNSAVAFVDTEQSAWQVQVFSIPQFVAAGQIESRETLPSFHFQPSDSKSVDTLSWEQRGGGYIVGVMAREEGQLSPNRLIASAKSWLCHHGVDRTAELLPWQGDDDVERLSPIAVSARYLEHLRHAWDAEHPDHPLADQDVILTLPASFDEVARELTVQAAARAGLPKVILIEEPQAAFYAWVDQHRDDWHQRVQPGQRILVCDIGGGTSDLTLIRVRRAAQEAADDEEFVQFHRIAVGEHVILGGDNLDLALAKYLESRLKETSQSLDSQQWDVLVRTCRQAKETLLGQDAPEQLTVHLPGRGRRLVGGGLQIEVTRQDAMQVLVDGFFPHTNLNAKPQRLPSGFQEFGLPYAADPAITRHVAAFLDAHRAADGPDEQDLGHDPARPDLILFNGGVFHADAIRRRLVDVVAEWFQTPQEPDWRPTVLDNDRLDLAVALGAAYYGMVRRGEGVRIAAGLARSYYLEVEPQTDGVETAVCVVPGSAQPGDSIDVPDVQFDLLVSEPIEFPLLVSSTRLTDIPGATIEVDPEQMRRLPALRTALRTQRKSQRGTVPVRLHAQLNEIGTIELWCSQLDQDRQWRLEFDVRSATETDRTTTVTSGDGEGVWDESSWDQCEQILDRTFGTRDDIKPNRVMRELSQALDRDRRDWPMSLLRRIWQTLIDMNEGRKRSAQHESRWLNLVGFALRPGYGMAVDDWRLTETWRLVQNRIFHQATECRNESWVLWRRVSAGLPSGQQRALAEPLLATVRALHRRSMGTGAKGEVHFSIPEFAEVWRLLASLELLTVRDKMQFGQMMLDFMPKRKFASVRPAIAWSIGRLGNRIPLYGPLNTVPDAKTAASWSRALLAHELNDPTQAFAIMQLTRRTGDRHRDVDAQTRSEATRWLTDRDAASHLSELVSQGGMLDTDEQQRAYGESLPKGLTIRRV